MDARKLVTVTRKLNEVQGLIRLMEVNRAGHEFDAVRLSMLSGVADVDIAKDSCLWTEIGAALQREEVRLENKIKDSINED